MRCCLEESEGRHVLGKAPRVAHYTRPPNPPVSVQSPSAAPQYMSLHYPEFQSNPHPVEPSAGKSRTRRNEISSGRPLLSTTAPTISHARNRTSHDRKQLNQRNTRTQHKEKHSPLAPIGSRSISPPSSQ